MASKNNSAVPQAREALEKFKMEAARDVGVQMPLNLMKNMNKKQLNTAICSPYIALKINNF